MAILTQDQTREFSKKLKINDSVVLREYYQLLFLKELYTQKYSEHIFFKGGTAIRLIFGGDRFSEDLDFIVMELVDDFNHFVEPFFKRLTKRYGWQFKNKKAMIGETYLLTIPREGEKLGIFINLDFSFREMVVLPDKSIIQTIYPIVFTSFIHHLSKEEVVAEKVRAILTRNKGRDIYDLWFLLSQGATLNENLVLEKLKYYDIVALDKVALVEKIKNFGKNQFILQLRPFVPVNQRNNLGDFYDYVVEYLSLGIMKA
jgi:predicted nucleotidyltransferase component of viral defense system